jgi:hypothetical protein
VRVGALGELGEAAGVGALEQETAAPPPAGEERERVERQPGTEPPAVRRDHEPVHEREQERAAAERGEQRRRAAQQHEPPPAPVQRAQALVNRGVEGGRHQGLDGVSVLNSRSLTIRPDKLEFEARQSG